jgi:hypothetical protein
MVAAARGSDRIDVLLAREVVARRCTRGNREREGRPRSAHRRQASERWLCPGVTGRRGGVT